MKFSRWLAIAVLACVPLLCSSAHAGLVAQWLAEDLILPDGGDLNEWPESLSGDPILEFNAEHGHFRAEATPGGTAFAEFNGDGFDNDESVQTFERSGSPVAGLTEFTVAVTFRPRADGENPNATDFWRNTAVVDGDIGGINVDWGTSWRGTNSFGAGLGQPPRDISVYAEVEGQDDLLDQWLTAVYSVNGAAQTHFALLVAEDGNFGVTPDDGSRDLGAAISPRGDFGVAFAVQRANVGGRNLVGDIAEVRFYDQAFSDDGALSVAEEMYQFHVGGEIVGTRLQAGDADMDLKFDQLDVVQVQIAAKYLTGQPATWGEGDWNGAPDGRVRCPQ